MKRLKSEIADHNDKTISFLRDLATYSIAARSVIANCEDLNYEELRSATMFRRLEIYASNALCRLPDDPVAQFKVLREHTRAINALLSDLTGVQS